MSALTWHKSASKDVRPFFGAATLENSVDGAEIRLTAGGTFTAETTHLVEAGDTGTLNVAIRPNLSLPAFGDGPLAKKELVLAITAAQPFMKKAIVVAQLPLSKALPDEVEIGEDVLEELGGGSNVVVEVALCLAKRLPKQAGSPFLLGHWLSKKSFSLRTLKLTEDFPIQPMDDEAWKKIGWPAKTLYSVEYIGFFNEPSEKDRQTAKVRVHSDVHKKLTLESSQRLAKPMLAALAAEIASQLIAASVSDWEGAAEVAPNSPLSAFLKRINRVQDCTFEQLKSLVKEPGMPRLRAILHAEQQSVRSIVEG